MKGFLTPLPLPLSVFLPTLPITMLYLLFFFHSSLFQPTSTNTHTHAHTCMRTRTKKGTHRLGHQAHTERHTYMLKYTCKNFHAHTHSPPSGNLTQLRLEWDSFSAFNNSLTTYCKSYISAESTDEEQQERGLCGRPERLFRIY